MQRTLRAIPPHCGVNSYRHKVITAISESTRRWIFRYEERPGTFQIFNVILVKTSDLCLLIGLASG